MKKSNKSGANKNTPSRSPNKYSFALNLKRTILSWTEPLIWVIDGRVRSVLDLGCGDGKMMDLITRRKKIEYSVGVDIFNPYIESARKMRTHEKYILKDIRKVIFPDKSFDLVVAVHTLEHMQKNDAWKLLSKMEKIAKNQVIIGTPIGEVFHPAVDGNKHQLHECFFYPEDFEKRGYKTVKYGWKWLLGDDGLIGKSKNNFVLFILYTLNIFATPIYFIFQGSCDYVFVAYKNIQNYEA